MRATRLLFTLLLVFTAMLASASNIKPDFAYPATVSKNAGADLEKAIDSNDAHAALNALIRYYVSQSLIDPESTPAVIGKAEEVSARFANDKLHGLFISLLARMYYNEYDSEKWKYDRRELPLTPLPENITEWSGAQYKAKIGALALQSVDGEDARGLSDCALTAYSDIIDFTPGAAVYFPTLLDFAYLNAVQLSGKCGNAKDKSLFEKKALDSSKPFSAQYVYWATAEAASSPDSPVSLINLMKRLSDNEYAGYILTRFNNASYDMELPVAREVEYVDDQPSDNSPDKEMQLKSEVFDLASGYLRRFPETPFRQEILDITGKITLPSVSVNAPSLCAVGTPFKVNISNDNATTLTVNVYKLKNGESDRSTKVKTLLSTRKPVVTHTIDFEGRAPFKKDTVISLSITEPGYYRIVPVIPDGNYGYSSYSSIRCIPVFPIAVSNIDKPAVAVVDPVTGAPLQGVGVTLKNDRKPAVNVGLTDKNGIATHKGLKDNRYVSLTYKGQTYGFPNVRVRDFNSHIDTAAIYHASVITDRAIYHPGEKLQLLAVLSKSYSRLGQQAKQNTCAGQRIIIKLYDTNYTEVASDEGVTDEYGRVKTEFDLPSDGLTGHFLIHACLPEQSDSSSNGSGELYVVGTHYIMVSDYKLPDFEVTDAVAANDTPAKGDVTVSAKATTYSGMPVANAKATVILSGKVWRWWRENSTKVFSTDVVTGEDGRLSVVIPDSVFAANKYYSFFEAAIEVESATGTKSTARVVFSTGKKYYISVDCDNVIDGNLPFAPKITIHAADGSTTALPLTWELKAKDGKRVAGGDYKGKINLKDVVPGRYRFNVVTADSTLADISKTEIVIYNTNSDVVPAESGIWVPAYNCTTDSGSYDILYGTPSDETWVYCTLSDGIGNMSEVTLTRQGKGYHHIPVTIPEGLQRVYVNLFTVNDLDVSSREIIVERKTQDKTLKIVGETFRDRLVPGSEETWKIRITGAGDQPRQSALMLDMYNKALDALWGHNISVSAYGSRIFSAPDINFTYLGTNRYSTSVQFKAKGKQFVAPQFNFYDQIPYDRIMIRGVNSSMMYSVEDRVMMKSAAPTGAPMQSTKVMDEMKAEDEFEAEEEMQDAGAAEMPVPKPASAALKNDSFDYRSDYVPLAVWAPMLTTDADGNICYSFTVPNANTTWRLIALAWTKDFENGSLVRDFVAAKPLMVQPNLPRFLRYGDKAVIMASVMNNSDAAVNASTVVEFFNPVTNEILDSKEYRTEIAPGMSATVSTDISADLDIDAIGYRIRTTNGEFSDGEQSVIRILPAEASLIETQPFYLNPGETEFTAQLPKEKGARISLTFMENPSWTVLTALPGLRTQIDEYANSAAAALYSAGIARGLIKDNPRLADAIRHWSENPGDSTLVSMLDRNEDLKIALLNATPWVQAAQSETERMANLALLLDKSQVDRSISQALDILEKLQQNDGGWKWSKWCDESSVWVTSNVLAMMADLKTLGWLPSDSRIDSMIKKALGFYDRKVEDTDLVYAIVRPQFGNVPVSSNGKSVIDRTIKEISTDWKNYNNDVTGKALVAEALFRNKEQILASEVLRSISEFGVMTKDQGLRFPSVNALYSYAILLKTYALIKPASPEVDGLRQQLIVRKQGSDWGTAVVTTEVVQSLLCSGSNWLVEAGGTNVSVGSHAIAPTSPVEKITGWLRADLSGYAGNKLKIETTGTGPSYGAVYSQFARNMADVKASRCDDLDIEKQTFVRRGTEWEEAGTLRVGDRVKVQLTIHCKRNLSYVSIIDQRPACYEPVDQIPGWLWSEGVGFYRENRDSRTQLHVVSMRPGTYLLTYEMNVNNAGEFSSGVASIQSQYAPEISAHSSGHKVTVEKK